VHKAALSRRDAQFPPAVVGRVFHVGNVPLSGEREVVPGIAETAREEGDARSEFAAERGRGADVVEDAVPAGVEPGKEGGSGRTAVRGGAVRAGEREALAGETLGMGREAGMAGSDDIGLLPAVVARFCTGCFAPATAFRRSVETWPC
jgi:hypothetical protein